MDKLKLRCDSVRPYKRSFYRHRIMCCLVHKARKNARGQNSGQVSGTVIVPCDAMSSVMAIGQLISRCPFRWLEIFSAFPPPLAISTVTCRSHIENVGLSPIDRFDAYHMRGMDNATDITLSTQSKERVVGGGSFTGSCQSRFMRGNDIVPSIYW